MNVVIRCRSCQTASNRWVQTVEDIPAVLMSSACSCGRFDPLVMISDPGSGGGAGGDSARFDDGVLLNPGGSGGGGGSGSSGGGSGWHGTTTVPASGWPRQYSTSAPPPPWQGARIPAGTGGAYGTSEYEQRYVTTASVPLGVDSWRYGQLRRQPGDWRNDPHMTTVLLADLLNLSPSDVEVHFMSDPAAERLTIRAYVLRVHAVEAAISTAALRFARDTEDLWIETVRQMARHIRDLVSPQVRVLSEPAAPKPALPVRALDLREDE